MSERFPEGLLPRVNGAVSFQLSCGMTPASVGPILPDPGRDKTDSDGPAGSGWACSRGPWDRYPATFDRIPETVPVGIDQERTWGPR